MIGRAALRLVDRLGSIGLLLYQVASCMWSGQFRMRVLVEQIAKIGVQSQPVVIITGAFTGAVLEAQTLFQLQTVRMETMGGAVVAVGMFRELGPVITGLMLAGRVGSAMAAEIGTMKVTEQVDALKSMNVDPVDYLVKPRIQAMLISMPILMMEAVLVGIASAYIVSVTAFNVDQAYWMHFMSKFVTMGDIIVALVKASCFRPHHFHHLLPGGAEHHERRRGRRQIHHAGHGVRFRGPAHRQLYPDHDPQLFLPHGIHEIAFPRRHAAIHPRPSAQTKLRHPGSAERRKL